MSDIRDKMLKRGVCLRCAAYYGLTEKKCHSMSPGCPVPEDAQIRMERFNEERKDNGRKKK